ncbi:MAG: hypothetical protein KIT36_21980, partial [Alphaproteobacteria bacterium]|nr:hypothetical protein [Alphaproteobacteria bacterium]
QGWALSRVPRYLFDCRPRGFAAAPAWAASADDIHVIITGGPGVKMTYVPLWAGGTRTVTRPLGAP